jgi:hypothetical protein
MKYNEKFVEVILFICNLIMAKWYRRKRVTFSLQIQCISVYKFRSYLWLYIIEHNGNKSGKVNFQEMNTSRVIKFPLQRGYEFPEGEQR